MQNKLELVITDRLIGKQIETIYKDNHDITFQGTVINETKQTIQLKTETGIKILPKERLIFCFSYKQKKLRINGSLFKGRPEERIKQEPKKKW